MVDRAEEIAQALNKVHICNLSSAVSAETWQELIEDYFVHYNAEDSDNELTDDSGDESIDVVERLPEDDEPAESAPLVVANQTSNILHDIQRDYVSENVEEERSLVAEFQCYCKLFNGQPCYKQFSAEDMTKIRYTMYELTTGNLFVLIIKFNNNAWVLI